MARPFTLFTGQWADLPLEEVCRLASSWGYDGLELACWGDHFEVDRALSEDGYLAGRHALLEKYGLKCWAISCHLVGQAVCDHPIDERHQAILPAADLGRRVAGGRPAAGGGRGRRHRAGGGRVRRADRDRVHRVVDLAHGRDVPAGARVDDRSRGTRTSPSAGTRSWTCSTPRACGSRTRCTRARSPTTSGPRSGRWRRWGTGRPSGSTSTRATSCGRTSTRSGSCSSSGTGSTTWTARRRASGWTGATGGWGRTCRGATPGAAGTSCRPGAATCPGRTCSARSTRSATPGRSRSSGRTRAWTG